MNLIGHPVLSKTQIRHTRSLSFLAGLMVVCLLLVISLHPSTSYAKTNNAKQTQNQKDFLKAYKAIKRNDRKAIAKYKKKLKDYPLAIYLDYHDYRLHMKDTPGKLVREFIKKHESSYLSDKLYVKYLQHLASKDHWTTYIKHYKPQKPQSLQCHYIIALSERNQLDKALKLAKPLWQNSPWLGKSCMPVDKLLRKHKKLTGEMIWDRIILGMNKRKFKLVKHLKKDLSKQERKMVDFWLKVYSKPSLVRKPLPKYIAGPVKKEIFSQGVYRLARKNPILAKQSLEKFHKQYGLNQDQYAVLKRKVALRSAYRSAPQAPDYLNEVNQTSAKNGDSLRWQAQLALKESNWATLLEVIDLMPEETQNDKQWRYWKARGLEATGQATGDKNAIKAAQEIYRSLAKHRHYYAFLAADKLNLDYQFNPNPVKKVDTKKLIKKYPELTRIKELMGINWTLSTKREWYHLLERVDKNELHAIAVLANEWQQHNQAIRSLAKARRWNDIELRFPTAHKGPVIQHADKNKVDPAWVYGVIRRESAFAHDAKSSVGAVGLMQLMPNTAKYIGKRIGVKKTAYKDLVNAKNNIQLGTAYLSYLSDKFNGNKVLATAAYNAGPRRVDSWMPKRGSLPADQWIDAIPFTETRNYVKAVLEYTTIFKSLLNKRYDRLKDQMPRIGKDKVKKTDPKHP